MGKKEIDEFEIGPPEEKNIPFSIVFQGLNA